MEVTRMKLLLQRRRPLKLKVSVSLKLLEKQLLMRLWPRAVTLNKRLKQRHKLPRQQVLLRPCLLYTSPSPRDS